MSAPNKNMRLLSPLLFFTCIFCAFPQISLKDHQGRKATLIKRLNIVFTVACGVFWTTVNVGAIYKEVLRLDEFRKKAGIALMPVSIMSLIMQSVLAAFSTVIVVSFGFVHPQGIHELFKNLDQVDFILDFRLEKTSWQFYIHFFAFCLIQIIHGYYNYSLWNSLLEPVYFHIYAIRILQIFQFSLVVFTTNTLCLHLYQRFKWLNCRLKRFDPCQDFIQDKNYKYFMFREVKKTHSILCDQVDSINDMFGLILLCFIVTAITMICYFVVHLLMLVSFQTGLNQKQKIQLLVICGSGMLFIIFQIISLACVGALLSAETTKTHKISYALLNILPRPDSKGSEQLFRKELKSLAIQSGFRQPFISTSGIFKVDFGILGAVIGSVTSYIIVAQQFLNHFNKIDE